MAFWLTERDVRDIVRKEFIRFAKSLVEPVQNEEAPFTALRTKLDDSNTQLSSKLKLINEQLNLITMKLSELPAAISTAIDPFRSLPAQLDKVKQEVITAIQNNNPSDPDVPQPVLDALAGLNVLGGAVKQGVDAVDALIVDAPPAPPAA